MVRPATYVAGVLVCVLSLTAGAEPQLLPQAPAPQAPVFKTAVDLVHLDVSVLDKNRAPVRGLTAKDFTVLEDGKPQPIAAFSAVDVPDPEPPGAPWMRTVSPDVQSNSGAENPEGRLFVLLLDDAMLPPHPGMLETARQVARKFLDRVTPADRVAVVFSASGRNQTFTNDRARLLLAIDSLKNGYASHLMGWDTARDPQESCEVAGPYGPKFDSDATFRSASLRTLRQVAETLISAPQRRKALIFVSTGVELDALGAAAPMRQDPCTPLTLKEQHRELAQAMPELFLRMQRANVTIYPIDPSGLGGFVGYLQGVVSSIPTFRNSHEPLPAFFDWLNPGPFMPQPDQLAQHVGSLAMDFLQTAASNTGGFAVANTNDYDSAVDRIFLENSSYYVIGYQQPPGSQPGSLHRIKVQVNRSDVDVRTRSGYYIAEAPKPGKGGKTTPASPLDTAITAPVPTGAFPMRVAIAPFAVPGKKDSAVTIVLGLEQPGVTKRTSYSVDLQTNAYRYDGRPMLVGRRHTATIVLVPTAGKSQARYDLLSQIALPPGRYELRLSAHRAVEDVNGSVYAEVEVPDFANASLSVSGLMMEAMPTDAVAPAGAFDALVPVVPTSSRAFHVSQQVTAYLRIYQGSKAAIASVAITATLRDRADKTVAEGTETLGPDQFHVGGHAADYLFPLPLDKLAPGPYLLTLDVVMGKLTVNRSVQFTVIK